MRVFLDGVEVPFPRWIEIHVDEGGETTPPLRIDFHGGMLTIQGNDEQECALLMAGHNRRIIPGEATPHWEPYLSLQGNPRHGGYFNAQPVLCTDSREDSTDAEPDIITTGGADGEST